MAEPTPEITLSTDGDGHGKEYRITVRPAIPLSITPRITGQIMRTPGLGDWGVDDDSQVTRLHSRNNQAGEEGLRGVRVIIEHLLG